MRVAAGAIAKKYLRECNGISIRGCLTQLGPIKLDIVDWSATEKNPFFCADPEKVSELEKLIASLQKEGNSIGARVRIEATGLPIGLGAPVFDKLDAEIAYAMMGINAVKGVEIGEGMQCVLQKGSEHRDEITPAGFLSNNAGGVLGGLSTGQDIIVSMAFKPTSSIRIPGKSINTRGEAVDVVTTGRHDPCVGIRGTPVAEAMLAIVLMDHVLQKG